MKKIILFLAAIALASCNDDLKNSTKEYEALKAEALEIHDEVMPKMSKLVQLQGNLQRKIAADSTMAVEGQAAIMSLKKADRDMMAWMKDYSEKFPFESEPPTNMESLNLKIDMLKTEIEEIKNIQRDFDNSIKKAQDLMPYNL
ncbi:MAG: hypothetical protein WBA16_02300 [Nonlabens sp.]